MSALLLAARHLLADRARWMKNIGYSAEDARGFGRDPLAEDAARWDVYGALVKAAGGEGPQVEAAVERLVRGLPPSGASSFVRLMLWHDDEARTHEDVLLALDLALLS